MDLSQVRVGDKLEAVLSGYGTPRFNQSIDEGSTGTWWPVTVVAISSIEIVVKPVTDSPGGWVLGQHFRSSRPICESAFRPVVTATNVVTPPFAAGDVVTFQYDGLPLWSEERGDRGHTVGKPRPSKRMRDVEGTVNVISKLSIEVRYTSPITGARLTHRFKLAYLGQPGFPKKVGTPAPLAAAGTPSPAPAPSKAAPLPCEQWRTIVTVDVEASRVRPYDETKWVRMQVTPPGRGLLSILEEKAATAPMLERKAALLKKYQRVTPEWPFCNVHMAPMEFKWADKSYLHSEGVVRCKHGAAEAVARNLNAPPPF